MAIKIAGTEVISDDKRILNNESLPDIRPSLLLDFANSKTLDPRITFTRGSTATYYDGHTTAKAEENLLTRSQDFGNAVWYKDGTTITTDNTTAPDGTTTADRITDSGVGTSHYAAYTLAISTSSAYSMSCYIKYGSGSSWVLIGFTGAAAAAYFDIQNGTVGTVGSGVSGSSITDVGNGWYRCELQTTYSVSPAFPQVRLVPSDGTANYTANGSYVYAWGAQVEQRSSATAYTATTSSPIVKYQPVLQTAASGEARFDHDPVTGESKGLLIEEARTNLMTNSETFDTWGKNNTSVSANTALAPDGTLSADKVYKNNTTNQASVSRAMSAATGDLTFTFYVKSAEYDTVGFTLFNATDSHVANGSADLTNGTVNTSAGTIGIEDIGNGWWRIRGSGTATASNSIMYIYPKDSTSYQGNGYSGIYVWGAQLEAGSFPTSYIPTSGSTVTRAQEDVTFSLTDSGWNQKETTIYTDIVIDHPVANSFPRILELAGAGYLALAQTGKQAYLQAVKSDFPTVNSDPNYITGNASYKIAASFSAGEGFAIGVDGDVNVQSGSRFYFEDAPSSFQILSNGAPNRFVSGYIKKLAFYPKRLPNATLQAMTEE